MPFTEAQNKALAAKLSAKRVKTREEAGRILYYLEGWYVISEANRVFGYEAWDRETLQAQCVWQGEAKGLKACSYVSRVRVRVRAGDTIIVRDGSGAGHGVGLSPGEAHEEAIKVAETDALKRALATFENPFGLALYDKEQQGVRQVRTTQTPRFGARPVSWVVLSPSGKPLSDHKDPVEYCSAVRRQLVRSKTADEMIAFWSKNQGVVGEVRKALPDLKTERSQHYCEILGALYTSRLQDLAIEKPTQPEKIDNVKVEDGVKEIKHPDIKPRRIRDKEHLRFVAAQPCLICGRSPSQSHHILYAQPRALGRKASDEWAVPLCAIHHRSLHDHGNEETRWKQQVIDPIKEARHLWQISHGLKKMA